MRLFRIVGPAIVLALLGGGPPCAAQGNPVVFEDGFDCRSWYRDVDGDQYGDPNDFVLTCTPDPGYVYDGTDCNDGNAAINPGVFDLPDDSAIDANCDGIDGTEVAAVFVATTGTVNSSCSKLQPCSSLAVGILRVTAQRTHLYMQAGLYPVGSLTLPNVSIWGGYDTAWQRSDFLGTGHLVELRPVASVAPAPAVVGFKIPAGRDISMADLMVVGPNATSDGHSSYVFHVLGSILRLHGVIVDQGDAVAGLGRRGGFRRHHHRSADRQYRGRQRRDYFRDLR